MAVTNDVILRNIINKEIQRWFILMDGWIDTDRLQYSTQYGSTFQFPKVVQRTMFFDVAFVLDGLHGTAHGRSCLTGSFHEREEKGGSCEVCGRHADDAFGEERMNEGAIVAPIYASS